MKITIAVDGHSSCGKSTLAKDLAKKLKYIYVDTGAMYRAITLKMIRKKIMLDDHSSIKKMLLNTDIHFKNIHQENHIFLDGENVEALIRTPEVAALVSPVSEISSIRKFLVELQRNAGKNKGVVMEGRDIGTVVFPGAELKFFVTADIETRTQRRYLELKQKGIDVTVDEVKNNLTERDFIDSNREDSPLKIHNEAILVDTSKHSRRSQIKEVYAIVQERLKVLS